MMKNIKSGYGNANRFVEEENWCSAKREYGARERDLNVLWELRNEAVHAGLRKPFIADEVYRIVANVLEGVGGIKVSGVAKLAKNMVWDIAELIVDLQSWNVDINRIPPLHSVLLEDGSFLIEWIFSKYRIGFVLEEKKDESIWYLVSIIEGNVEASGPLSGTNYKKLLAELVLFVFGNS